MDGHFQKSQSIQNSSDSGTCFLMAVPLEKCHVTRHLTFSCS
jgi:hypothetical protein